MTAVRSARTPAVTGPPRGTANRAPAAAARREHRASPDVNEAPAMRTDSLTIRVRRTCQ